MTIDLDQSLTQQFPEFMDAVRASVYDCGRPFKAIAADLVDQLTKLMPQIHSLLATVSK